jgi:hypothetical protein
MDYNSEEIEAALMQLYELGFIEVDYDENLEARFKVTDEKKFDEYLKGYRDDV